MLMPCKNEYIITKYDVKKKFLILENDVAFGLLFLGYLANINYSSSHLKHLYFKSSMAMQTKAYLFIN